MLAESDALAAVCFADRVAIVDRTRRSDEGISSARSSTDRASDYGSEGWGFESLRARQGVTHVSGHRNDLAPYGSLRCPQWSTPSRYGSVGVTLLRG